MNVSLNMPVIDYSSHFSNDVWAASNINDGIVNSDSLGWASVTGSDERDEWVIIDLGTPQTLDSFTIQNEYRNDNRNVKDYVLYGSNSGDFTGEEFVITSGTIPSLLQMEEYSETFTPTTARYVKFQGTSSYSVYVIVGELSLFSSGSIATAVTEFPRDLQLYPRDTTTNLAPVTVSGSIDNSYTAISLNVYREDALWNSWDHSASDSQLFTFPVQLPAELANYDFELIATDGNNAQTTLASANDVVAGDVFVINGQSNAASGLYESAGPGNDDASDFIRSFGVMGLDEWVDNDEWHIGRAECRPLSIQTGCIGRWGLRFASQIVTNEQVPVAVVNGARGGRAIDYFERNDADTTDITTNYGRLLTRLTMGALENNIRGLMWYQGESDRLDVQGHMDGFRELFADWEDDYPSIERYYIFQIRHTCVPSDLVTGQGSGISNFQREFANENENVTAVSTTGIDGHDGCHFAYTDGYQIMGDNISRMVRDDLYDSSLQNADAPDVLTAELTDSKTVELIFTEYNTLIADDGFEALFELRDANNDQLYAITGGSVLANSAVQLTTAESIPDGTDLTVSYLSLSGDQDWLTNQAGIGILSFLDFPVGDMPVVVVPANALEIVLAQLEAHIDGEVTLSYTELNELRETITNNLDLLEAMASTNIPTFEYGFQIIQAYENEHGALFTDSGTKQFNPTSDNDDGNALARAIYEVYQGVFDLVDADLLRTYPEIIDGLAFGSANYFPGSVPSPTDPNAVYEMEINASVPRDWGRPNLYSELPARRSTGAYLAPGTIAEVIVPQELVDNGYEVRVGGHTWDLSDKNTYKRLSRATKLFPINSTVTQVANPLGGNIYIEVPHLADEGIVTVQFKNTIRAPFFSARSFDQMTAEEWQTTERYHPGAWADFESDKVMLHVPSKWVREYDEAVDLIVAWDEVMDGYSDYMGKPRLRNKTLAYMQVDVIMRGNAFYPGYPMGNYPTFSSDTPRAPLNFEAMLEPILGHEHGHATYMTKFNGETEAIVHMLHVYVANQLYEQSLHQSFVTSLAYNQNGNSVITMQDVFNSWVLMDPFLNDDDMAHQQAAYKHRGHAKYVEIVDLFGWDAMTNFNRQLHVDYEESGYDFSRNNHEPNDRILRLSRAAGADLRPLIHLWGKKPGNDATLKSQLETEGLLPSAEIYDLMVDYKPQVILTQAEYDDFYSRMRPVVFLTEFWDGLGQDFDPARGEAAIARIDELIDYYFPDGRPTDGPSNPEVTEVTVYGDPNYEGAAWVLGEGIYGIGAIRDSEIGNDAISSIQIPSGYSVKACQHGNGSGICETYTTSMPQLGSLNNQISRIEVQSSSTPTNTPTAMPTDIPVPPTNTPVPPTNTPVPPTATPTPVVVPESASIVASTHTIGVGEEVMVVLESYNLERLGTATIEVVYDPAVLTIVGCNKDPNNVFALIQCNQDFGPDRIRFNVTSLTGTSGDVTIAELTFQATGQNGDQSDITILLPTLADSAGNELIINTIDGKVSIAAARMGDVNCDITRNTIDAMFILQYDVGRRTASTTCPSLEQSDAILYMPSCDVSGDGMCSAVDALLTLQCDVGIANASCPTIMP